MGCVFKILNDLVKTKAALLLASVFLVSCNVQKDNQYSRAGIGTNLYGSGLAKELDLEEMYFGYLCAKAGLSVYPSGQAGGLPRCRYDQFLGAHWNNLVQAGFNDIDRRCDAYLAWYEEKKRTAPVVSAQLNSTSQFVQAIINIYEPTTAAIKVVSHAFGFASTSFDNYNKRLLFMIENSTLQSFVLTRQQKFRTELVEQEIGFDGKPAVENALRSYLRICLPMTIETEINDLLTVFDRTGSGPSKGLVNVDSTRAAVRATALRANDKVDSGGGRGTVIVSLEARKLITLPNRQNAEILKIVQNKICIGPGELGKVGARTRQSYRIFEDYVESVSSRVIPDGMVNTIVEYDLVTGRSDCDGDANGNVVEFDKLSGEVQRQQFAMLLKLQTSLQLPTGFAVNSPEFRAVIEQANAAYGIENFYGGARNDQLTLRLYEALRRGKPQP